MAKKILTREEVHHLAKLAKLTLTEVEIKKYQKQLSETLDYVENLKEIETDNITSDFYTTKARDVFFKDKMSHERILSDEEVMANAKRKSRNLFIVKRIL